MIAKVVNVGKVLMISYIITGVLLMILSFCLYKFGLGDALVTIGIIVIYALSTFVGGYIMARLQGNRRLMWGIAFGVLYFLILTAASLIMNKGLAINVSSALRAFIVCAIAGALGGFVTPVKE